MTPLTKAQQDLVMSIRPNVVKQVASACRRNPSLKTMSEDLIQAGLLGAMAAAVSFNPSAGHTFLTYAYRAVSQRIYKEVNNRSRDLFLDDYEFPEQGKEDMDRLFVGNCSDAVERIKHKFSNRDVDLFCAYVKSERGDNGYLARMFDISKTRVGQIVNDVAGAVRAELAEAA